MHKFAPSLIPLLLIALSPAGFAAEPASEHHALWSLHGKTNTIYLLGSVHFLRPSDELPEAIKKAYRESEKIIMELDMDDLDPLEAQQSAMTLGLLPADRDLESEVGVDAYRKAAAAAKELGLDPDVLKRFKPWLAAMTLVQLQLMKQGLDPASGVEQRLVGWARTDGKEITGFETLQQQLSLLADLPANQQREFLLYSVEDAEHASEEVETLISAWRTGDTHRLEGILTEGFERYPDLYRPLTIDRNKRWLDQVDKLLDDHEDYLIVVGTLHLIGKGSLVDLLQRQGHEVKQQ
ncbi:MAG: TraB/GumN family protein [Povalibacter sp.]